MININDVVALEWNKDKTDYREWTVDEIRKGFNFGKGTIKDFKRYMSDNKHVKFTLLGNFER